MYAYLATKKKDVRMLPMPLLKVAFGQQKNVSCLKNEIISLKNSK
jgi:hypothetical protein